MELADLFKRLSFAELSNLSVGTSGGGTIKPEKTNQLISHVNEGLLRLYSRFILKYNCLLIEQQNHITHYHLQPEFARLNTASTAPFKYIRDQDEDPFTGDVIKILEVFSDGGSELPLNDPDHPMSLFTPQPTVLQIPVPKVGQNTVVTYQAAHPRLVFDDLSQKITVPYNLEGALTAYVAHLVYMNMNGQENTAKSMEYLAKYDSICAENVINDLTSNSMSSVNLKFIKRGFV